MYSGYSAETLFQHCAAKRGCRILVFMIDEVPDHCKKIREHICRDEGLHVRQESVLKILPYSLQDADANFHSAGEHSVNVTFEVDNVCVPGTKEVCQER